MSSLNAGASHASSSLPLSFNGEISLVNLGKLETAVGKEHLVPDLSCSRKDGAYYIGDRPLAEIYQDAAYKSLLDKLAGHCSGFLVHGTMLRKKQRHRPGPGEPAYGGQRFSVTYAGGNPEFEDLSELRTLGTRLH